jgi:hypothetical protein
MVMFMGCDNDFMFYRSVLNLKRRVWLRVEATILCILIPEPLFRSLHKGPS